MKKALAILLTVLMLLSVLPVVSFAAEIPDGAIAVPFSGDGDWIVSTVKADNTKSYEIGYELALPVLAATSEPNTWCDTAQLVIRNASVDNYFKFELQSYINGGGNYQIATSAQVWNGSSWSDRPFEWSEQYAARFESVLVVLRYDKDTHNFSWKVTDKATNTVLKEYTFSGEMITEPIYTCSDCELRMYRSNTAIAPANAYIKYVTAEPADPAAAIPVTFSGEGDWVTADAKPDNTKSYEIGYELALPVLAATSEPNTWCDTAQLVIRNAQTDNYFKFEVQSYINGGGNFQVASSAQVWNGSAWSDRPFEWSEQYAARFESVLVVLRYDKDTHNFSWKITDKATNTVLKEYTFSGEMITESLYTCSACELRMYRSNTAIAPANAYIKYGDAPVPEEPAKTPADFGWGADTTKWSFWTAEDEGNFALSDRDASAAAGENCRCWKDIITDKYFTWSFDLKVDINSRVYFNVLGTVLEAGVNADGAYWIPQTATWLLPTDGVVRFVLTRAGGDVTVTVTPTGGQDYTWTMTPASEIATVEFGMWNSANTGFAVKNMTYTKNDPPEFLGKTVVLHTNDVHGAIANYAYVAGVKAEYEAKGAEVILADAGDFSQGTTSVSLSKGKNAVDLMNMVGYDVATLGNHEFDYGAEQLFTNLGGATFAVTCSDVLKDGSPIYNPYVIFNKGGVKIAFIGLETPEAQTKANPAMIQGLTFLTNDTTPTIWDNTKAVIAAAKTEGADIIIGLTHLGVDGESLPYRSVDLWEQVRNDMDFIIDGHSHTVMVNGPQHEPIQSTGTAVANIGVIVIDNATKKIESNYLYEVTESTPKDEAVAAAAQAITDAIAEEYGAKFAESRVNLNGAKAPNGNRDSETNNGDFITDAMIWCVTEQYPGSITGVPAENIVAITNGGGIRAAIGVGDVTKNDIFTVLPFGNTVAVVYVTGTELLEALEASTYCTPDAVGGFPQVSGLKFNLKTYFNYKPNAETYPGSTYYGPKAIKRVEITEINGRPFDPTATYAVVTNNFCAGGGDTYYAFAAASSQFDTGYTLDAVVMDYVTEKLGGVIGEQYAEPQGRINIISKVPATWTAYKYELDTDGIDPDGKYLVVSDEINGNGKTYLMRSNAFDVNFGNYRASAYEVPDPVDDIIVLGGAGPEWTFTASGDGYTLSDGDRFINPSLSTYWVAAADSYELTVSPVAGRPGSYFLLGDGRALYFDNKGGVNETEGIGGCFRSSAFYTTEGSLSSFGVRLYKLVYVGDPDCEHEWVADHDYDVAPTCLENGAEFFECSICGETKTEPVAPLGHDYIYTDNGEKHTVTCSRCDYTAEENHNYVGGICTLCGGHLMPTVTVKSATNPKARAQGMTETFTATLKDGTDAVYTWSTDNEAAVKFVSAEGADTTVEYIGGGDATITVTVSCKGLDGEDRTVEGQITFSIIAAPALEGDIYNKVTDVSLLQDGAKYLIIASASNRGSQSRPTADSLVEPKSVMVNNSGVVITSGSASRTGLPYTAVPEAYADYFDAFSGDYTAYQWTFRRAKNGWYFEGPDGQVMFSGTSTTNTLVFGATGTLLTVAEYNNTDTFTFTGSPSGSTRVYYWQVDTRNVVCGSRTAGNTGHYFIYQLGDIIPLEDRVDHFNLKDAIASAEALNEATYSVDSWAALQAALDAARAADALEETTQAALDEAEAALRAAVAALETKLNEAIRLIGEIGEVTLESKDAIDAAREHYNALSDSDKNRVTNYITLLEAEAAYLKLLAENGGVQKPDLDTLKETSKKALEKLADIVGQDMNEEQAAALAAALEEALAAIDAAEDKDAVLAAVDAAVETLTAMKPCKHVYFIDEEQSAAPTCLEDGVDVYVCEKCGDSYSEILPALGHDFQDEVTEPTCTDYGFTTHTCSRCGVTNVDTIVDALGHEYDHGVCIRCGAEDPDYVPEDPCEGYTDVDRDMWYHDAVDFVIGNGYMYSTSEDALTFEPMTKVTRAGIVDALYRVAGSPAVEFKGTFTDVTEDNKYAAAIEWAAENSIAAGKGDGKFDPDGLVTRQELAVFMYKMSEFLGKDVTATAELTDFADAAKVPAWAESYLKWAVAVGLISGKSSGGKLYLAPTDNAMRSEYASILMRFV